MEFRVWTRESRSCCCSIQGNSAICVGGAVPAQQRELQGDVAELDLGARGRAGLPLHVGGVDVDAVQAALVLDGEAPVLVEDAGVGLGDGGLGQADVVVAGAARGCTCAGFRKWIFSGRLPRTTSSSGHGEAAPAVPAAMGVGVVLPCALRAEHGRAMMTDGAARPSILSRRPGDADRAARAAIARALRPPPPWPGPPAVVGAAPSPPWPRIAPVLGILRGPLGLVVALLALAVAVAALAPGSKRCRLLAALAPRRGLALPARRGALVHQRPARLGRRAALPADGPEPLARARPRPARQLRAGGLAGVHARARCAPHYGAPRADGRPYPAHSPGLPLLLAPLYALAGGSACVLALPSAGAALAVQVLRAARRLGASEAALLGLGGLALVPPVAFYAFHVYTEVPSALALVGAALRLILGGPPVAAAAAGAALLASSLPWLHLKMIPAALAWWPRSPSGACADAARPPSSRSPPHGAPASCAYYHAIFGVASPAGHLRRRAARTRADRRCARWRDCCSTARSACCRTRRCSSSGPGRPGSRWRGSAPGRGR